MVCALFCITSFTQCFELLVNSLCTKGVISMWNNDLPHRCGMWSMSLYLVIYHLPQRYIHKLSLKKLVAIVPSQNYLTLETIA